MTKESLVCHISSTATSTSFAVNFPITFSNAPACFVELNTQNYRNLCSTTTSAATITFATALVSGDSFDILIIGNGP